MFYVPYVVIVNDKRVDLKPNTRRQTDCTSTLTTDQFRIGSPQAHNHDGMANLWSVSMHHQFNQSSLNPHEISV